MITDNQEMYILDLFENLRIKHTEKIYTLSKEEASELIYELECLKDERGLYER